MDEPPPNSGEDPSEEEEDFTGAVRDPLAEPPASLGCKAPNPYEGTESDDTPGPTLRDQLEDDTPATDTELHEDEEF